MGERRPVLRDPREHQPGYWTLVNPTVTDASCNASNIKNEPYYSTTAGGRRTLSVHDNVFKLTPANMPNCTGQQLRPQGVFSN